GEQRPLPSRPQWERPAAAPNLERAQNSEVRRRLLSAVSDTELTTAVARCHHRSTRARPPVHRPGGRSSQTTHMEEHTVNTNPLPESGSQPRREQDTAALVRAAA